MALTESASQRRLTATAVVLPKSSFRTEIAESGSRPESIKNYHLIVIVALQKWKAAYLRLGTMRSHRLQDSHLLFEELSPYWPHTLRASFVGGSS